VCRSLFEEHKLLFSFLLCTKIKLHRSDEARRLDATELRFFLQGSLSMDVGRPNPTTVEGGAEAGSRDWLTDKAWADMWALSSLPAFAGLAEHAIAHTGA